MHVYAALGLRREVKNLRIRVAIYTTVSTAYNYTSAHLAGTASSPALCARHLVPRCRLWVRHHGPLRVDSGTEGKPQRRNLPAPSAPTFPPAKVA